MLYFTTEMLEMLGTTGWNRQCYLKLNSAAEEILNYCLKSAPLLQEVCISGFEEIEYLLFRPKAIKLLDMKSRYFYRPLVLVHR